MDSGAVVVGIDGSPANWVTWRWATAEAARRGALLRLVCAYRAPWPFEKFITGTELGDAALSRAETVVTEMVSWARSARPGLVVTGEAVCGDPAAVLFAALHGSTVSMLSAVAQRAELLVVGDHGQRGFTGKLLGATGLHLAVHARVPVAVVRGRADPDTGPVVVGTDGSPGADVAIGTALEEANLLGCGLTVAHAYPVPAPPWNSEIEPLVYDPQRLRAAVRAVTEEQLAPWQEKFPDVPVEIVAAPEDAAGLLVRLSREARLVVVGSRGHGGFAGLLLGSVGQKLLHHADCPVLIARTSTGGRET
ncbi:universal stress protein [Virgisporangium aliadipatigenens]|uniref:Universal stress protein n=1 Tax=Virgisporangium aliadipatigenens TaxID=741659 RepID=A0A8J4DSF2_9ACTN|nr:universal stress protein [Virgisporangium aliadipatigenens]GIJ48116.1 universal stress protein [Virgisporangium aliadipatigenens]